MLNKTIFVPDRIRYPGIRSDIDGSGSDLESSNKSDIEEMDEYEKRYQYELRSALIKRGLVVDDRCRTEGKEDDELSPDSSDDDEGSKRKDDNDDENDAEDDEDEIQEEGEMVRMIRLVVIGSS